MGRADTVTAALIACATVWGLAHRCGSSAPIGAQDRPAATSPSSATETTSSTTAASTSTTTSPSATPITTTTTTPSAVVANHTREDLRFLATVERHTRGDVPPAIRQLVAMRRDGASDETLRAHIDSALRGDLVLRRAALDWLRGGTAETPPSRLGRGGAPRRARTFTPME